MAETRSLDLPERLTASGIGLLRISSGLFFLTFGLLKSLSPDFLGGTFANEMGEGVLSRDLLALIEELQPDYKELMEAHLPPTFLPLVRPLIALMTGLEIVGGLMLLLGWNARLAVLPLAALTVGAGIVVVQFDSQSDMQALSLAGHIMAAGLYMSLFLLGSGRWALDGGRDLVQRVAKSATGDLRRLTRYVVSGSGRNAGVFWIRASVAFPFLFYAAVAVGRPDAPMIVPEAFWQRAVLITVSLIGGLSMVTGFRLRQMAWILVLLTLAHLYFVALVDTANSEIGLINIALHFLILAAILSNRLIEVGSDLQIEHILNLDKKNIVVIGGGFAGATLVKRLERRLPHDYQVVLVSEQNYMTMNPLLAEIVSATILPSHTIAPLRRMVRRTRFMMGQVAEVDMDKREILVEAEDKTGIVPFEHLIFACGSRANIDIVPGMARYAMPFKLAGDAMALRNQVIAQMEKADLERDDDKRKWLGHFIVVGGGFSGVEVAGAIQDFLHDSQKHYPRLQARDLKVSLVHAGALPIPELASNLGRYTKRSLQKRGVDLYLEASVKSVDGRGVEIADGRRVDGATIVCTIGTKSNPLVDRLPAERQRGRLITNPDMSVPGLQNAWAIGDCALVPNAHDGSPSPPTAQFAVRQGRQLADNLLQIVSGGESSPFNYKPRGSMATIGHMNGVASLMGVQLRGLPAWLLWRAYYLSFMPTILKKAKLFIEWTWSMLFSADIVDLRYSYSVDVDLRPERERPARPGLLKSLEPESGFDL